ncbi:uncharacterized protein LOC105279232 [Ooceraea biroi]|nr:uncharacterized protein LOC105279232 [Ooceraea biroi]EZA55345.1 hypothetical protein X777_04799 [Ooceraea biroi]
MPVPGIMLVCKREKFSEAKGEKHASFGDFQRAAFLAGIITPDNNSAGRRAFTSPATSYARKKAIDGSVFQEINGSTGNVQPNSVGGRRPAKIKSPTRRTTNIIDTKLNHPPPVATVSL